jgi:hypothetical protein
MVTKNAVPKLPVEEGKKSLQFLRSLKDDELKNIDFSEIKKHTNVLVRMSFAGGILPSLSTSVLRGVVLPFSDVDDAKCIKKLSRFSYPPKSTNFALNRASSNLRQVFYGAVPTAGFEDLTNFAAVLEISPDPKTKKVDGNYEYIGLTKWLIKEDMFCATVGIHHSLTPANNWSKEMSKFSKDMFSEIPDGDFADEVQKFMAEQFTQEVKKGEEFRYKISAAYGDGLFDAGVDAIMYPSVKMEGKTFNIAIRSDSVQECLDPEIAARGTMLTEDELVYGWYLVCERIYSSRDQNQETIEIKWDVPPSGTQITGNDIARYLKIVESGGKLGMVS